MAAVGSIVVTATDIGGGYTKYSVAWTSDASGNVSGTSFDVKRGLQRQRKFIPGAGGTQPTDAYDVTVTDPDGADILVGSGANLSNATATWSVPSSPPFFEAQAVTPVVANAGNAKTGTIVLFVGP